MAKFVVNSTNTRAVRKEDISHVVIGQRNGTFNITLSLNIPRHSEILFEEADTEQAINQKASSLLAELES